MNKKPSSEQTGSLRRQISQRVLTLGVVAVLGLLGLVGVGLQSSFQSSQIQLNLVRESANNTFTKFLGGLNDDLRATSDTLTTTPKVDDVFIRALDRQPAIFELDYVNPSGQVLAHRRRVGQGETTFAEQPWLETVKTGKTYIGSVDYSAFGVPFVTIAVPVTDKTGGFKGTLLALTDLTALWRPVTGLKVGTTGYVYITDNTGQLLAYKDLQQVQSGLKVNTVIGRTPQAIAQGNINMYSGLDGGLVIASAQALDVAPWFVIVEQPVSEALSTLAWISLVLMFLLVFVVIQASGAFRFTQRRIVVPLERLHAGVKELLNGQMEHPIVIEAKDELGELAGTFNSMSAQLQDMIGTLEQRVTDRTKALSTVAEISTAASTILETDKLLQEVVNLSKEQFGLYHAHIYLLNDAGDALVLSSGAGEVGRQMVAEGRSIPLDREQSLVARAAREKKGVTVNDVTTAPDFLPNPLLPDTHSEMAVPMMVGEQVVGVFDVQSEVVGRFTDSDISVQTTLASQIAAAIHNARSYTKVREAEQLTRTIIDATTDAIFIKDREHRYLLVNEGYSHPLHMPANELIGKDDLELGFPEELVKGNLEKGIRGFWTDDNLVFETGKTQHYPNDPVIVDGVPHTLDTLKIPLRNADGQIWGVLGFSRDVTEREHLHELTAQHARQQEAINRTAQKIQSTITIEEALQVAAREVGHVLGGRETIVVLEPPVLEMDWNKN